MERSSLEDIIGKARSVLLRYGVKRAAIFGSFARGEESRDSDIDILVEFAGDDKTLIDLISLREELEEELGREVDVVTYSSIHPLLRKRILSEQMVIL